MRHRMIGNGHSSIFVMSLFNYSSIVKHSCTGTGIPAGRVHVLATGTGRIRVEVLNHGSGRVA